MNEDNFYLAEIISDFFYNAVLLFNAFILACSAVRIRKTIKSLHNVFPNEGFIKVHVANSILYTILYTVYIITVLVLFKIADADDIPNHFLFFGRIFLSTSLQTERWWWDVRLQSCQPFLWTGCAGNANNFQSKKLCLKKCGGNIWYLRRNMRLILCYQF